MKANPTVRAHIPSSQCDQKSSEARWWLCSIHLWDHRTFTYLLFIFFLINPDKFKQKQVHRKCWTHRSCCNQVKRQKCCHNAHHVGSASCNVMYWRQTIASVLVAWTVPYKVCLQIFDRWRNMGASLGQLRRIAARYFSISLLDICPLKRTIDQKRFSIIYSRHSPIKSHVPLHKDT